MMRLSLAGLLAIVLGVISPMAKAEDCGRNRALNLYAQAVTAARQNQTEAALAGFRALAEEGFAPAQRRLGELLQDQSGSPADAYWWTAIAVKRGDWLARQFVFTLEKNMNVVARMELDHKVESWRPIKGPCTLAFIERRKAGSFINAQEFMESFYVDTKVGRPPQQVINELGKLLFYVADSYPEFLPYLTSVGAIHVVPLQAAARIAEPPQAPPYLEISADLLAHPDQTKVPAVMTAMRDLVHRLADPPPLTKVDYRGRQVWLKSYGSSDAALALVKQAIDMAEKLPPELRSLAALPKTLVVEPLRAGEEKRAIATLVKKQGDHDDYVRFSSLPGSHSAIDVVAGLVSVGYRQGHPNDSNTGDQAEEAAERARKFLKRS